MIYWFFWWNPINPIGCFYFFKSSFFPLHWTILQFLFKYADCFFCLTEPTALYCIFLFHSFHSLAPEFRSVFYDYHFFLSTSFCSCVYCFPDFSELSRFSCSLLTFFKTILLNCQVCYRTSFLWGWLLENYLFFWWCKFLRFLNYYFTVFLHCCLCIWKSSYSFPDFMV